MRLKSLETPRLQVVRRQDRGLVQARHHRGRRPQRLRQVERRRRDALGDGRAVAAAPARQGHGGRDLRGLRGPRPRRHGRGRAHASTTADGTAPPAFAAYAEIQISRRLYRTGESEYLINKTPVPPARRAGLLPRHRHRHQGLHDRGAGQIAEIVSAKPEERRSLIEEAAGIGKYKARRREAETQARGHRAEPAARERRAHRDPAPDRSIERQAKKAARYKRLRETLRVLELSLAADERARARARRSRRPRRRSQRQRDAATARETQLAERELARRRRKRLELGRVRADPRRRAARRCSRCARDIKELEGQIEYERRERESLAELVEARARRARASCASSARRTSARSAQLAEELAAVERGASASRRESLRGAEAEVREARERRCARSSASARPPTRRSSRCSRAIARAEDRLAAVEDRRAELERAPAQRRRGARAAAGRGDARRRASSATSRRGCAICSPSATA